MTTGHPGAHTASGETAKPNDQEQPLKEAFWALAQGGILGCMMALKKTPTYTHSQLEIPFRIIRKTL